MAGRGPRVEKPALLVRVLTEIGSGDIYEDWIADDKELVHGIVQGRKITVNPAIEVVDTLIHEILHRLQPNWTEKYVNNRTTWLMRRMSDEQIQALYAEYQKRAVKRKVKRDGVRV